jgi:hypothetical protein
VRVLVGSGLAAFHHESIEANVFLRKAHGPLLFSLSMMKTSLTENDEKTQL